MADPTNGSPPPARRRRSSFTEMFARPSVDVNAANTVNGNGPRTGSLSNALQSRARRMSITSIGLSGSPTHGAGSGSVLDSLRNGQGPPPGAKREGSDGSEEAVEDADEVPPLNGDRPTSPSMQRRFSFGTRAYRAGSSTSNGSEQFPGSDGSGGSPNGSGSPPGMKKDGFNWSENLRNRAQRSSISAASGTATVPAAGGFNPMSAMSGMKDRAKSVSDQGTAAPAPPPAPKPAPKAPDHFQEKILKGDFYMD